MNLHNKKATVIGLGVSNTPLIKYLLDNGALVTVRDRRTRDALSEEGKKVIASGIEFIGGEDYLADIDADIIFRTPGLRYDCPELVKAQEKGALLTSEMELFFELCPCHTIAVTGSDGKTTTTTLIYKMLEKAGKRAFVGGNIGAPLLPKLSEMKKDDYAVLELSSFQLHTMKKSPEIAVITNLSPNHLDYHSDMAEYVEAKTNIFTHQKPGDTLVLNAGNEITASLKSKAVKGVRIIHFNGVDGVYEKDAAIYYGDERVVEVKDILLPGRHNVENYMAAIGAVYPIAGRESVAEIAKTFGGVEHRLELVRVKDGVRFYNSSIDSSPSRTKAALSAFGSEKVIVILGGYDKKIPYEPLAEPVIKNARCAVLTGATAPKIRKAIEENENYKSSGLELYDVSDFEEAVKKAASLAEKGEAVVLSPASASFDKFPNFAVRGNTFRDIVRKL